jgi:exonuclease I
MQTAIVLGGKSKHAKAEAKPLSHIQMKYNQARKNETKFHNLEYSPAVDSLLLTNEDYVENLKLFHKRKKTLKHSLTVLDLFCGIGSGTVILKKLKIPLKKVVHVKHDPVAVKVSQFNHGQSDEAKYGLSHVYIESFEEVYGEKNEGDYEKISKLIVEHGPFDLVLSAAPCQNYSQVNAYANKSKYNAQYLLKAGRLIKLIDKIQKEKCGRLNKVFFLSENVVFPGYDDICKSYGDHENGLCPIELCASDFSPCRRKRYYWTNVS